MVIDRNFRSAIVRVMFGIREKTKPSGLEYFNQKLSTRVADLHKILSAHNISTTQEELQSQIAGAIPQVQDMLRPRFSERVMAPLGGVRKLFRGTAVHVAREGLEYQAATGNNPNLGLGATAVLTAVELGLSLAEQSGAVTAAIASFGLGGVPAELTALGVDAAVDRVIGASIENIKFPRRKLFGQSVEHRSVDHVVNLAGLAPVIPVALTLAAFQVGGRQELRKMTRGDVTQLKPEAQDVLVESAALSTLRRYSGRH